MVVSTGGAVGSILSSRSGTLIMENCIWTKYCDKIGTLRGCQLSKSNTCMYKFYLYKEK